MLERSAFAMISSSPMSALELFFHHEASPYVRRVLLVCEELELHPRETKVDSSSQEAMHAYAEVNPNRRFPALRDGDFVVWESHAIAAYLASHEEAGGEGRALLGRSTRAEFRVLQWCFWELAHFASAALPLVNARLGFLPKPTGSERELVAAFDKACGILSAVLETQDYVADVGLTIADLAIASDFSFADEAELPLRDFPSLRRWLARVAERPSWQRTEARKHAALDAFGIRF